MKYSTEITNLAQEDIEMAFDWYEKQKETLGEVSLDLLKRYPNNFK